METLLSILESVLQSYKSIWPYLLITIPLAVAVQLSGISGKIGIIFNQNPVVAILLATAIGAFSPLCSCGVIPLITSLLIGGVPLAPVMSFWIASPSVDPELLPLSIATVGYKLSAWRIGSSVAISLVAGFVIHFATVKGYLKGEILRTAKIPEVKPASQVIAQPTLTEVSCCVTPIAITSGISKNAGAGSCTSCSIPVYEKPSQLTKVLDEIIKATLPLLKYMTLAFIISALINRFINQDTLISFFSTRGWQSVVWAALAGIPTYTSNLMALPLMADFLSMGMNPAAALAFLLAGPVTTIPAMIAVWGIARRKVFFFYLAFSFLGALMAGFTFLFFAN